MSSDYFMGYIDKSTINYLKFCCEQFKFSENESENEKLTKKFSSKIFRFSVVNGDNTKIKQFTSHTEISTYLTCDGIFRRSFFSVKI